MLNILLNVPSERNHEVGVNNTYSTLIWLSLIPTFRIPRLKSALYQILNGAKYV